MKGKDKTPAPAPADWKAMLVWAIATHTWKLIGFILVVVACVIALNISCRVSRDNRGNLRIDQINLKPRSVKIGDTAIQATAESHKESKEAKR